MCTFRMYAPVTRLLSIGLGELCIVHLSHTASQLWQWELKKVDQKIITRIARQRNEKRTKAPVTRLLSIGLGELCIVHLSHTASQLWQWELKKVDQKIITRIYTL